MTFRAKCLSCLLGVAMLLIASQSPAQAVVPETMMEGRITSVDIANRKLYVMGIPVYIPTEVMLWSPNTRLLWKDFAGKPLPGRSVPGFLGGTAIVDAKLVDGALHARRVDVTPDENVLIGPAAWIGGKFTILGKRVVLVSDYRMRGEVTNGGGFPVDLATTPEGAECAAEGYLGEDGMFYAFLIETEFAQMKAGLSMTTIASATHSGDRLEIEGHTTALSGQVKILNAETNKLIGFGTIQAGATYGSFRVRFEDMTTFPKRVRVVSPDGSSASMAVTA